MAALVLLAMFLWICGSNPAVSLPLLGTNFINPTMVVFVVISLMLVTDVIDFDDIIRWTIGHFGTRQARSYAAPAMREPSVRNAGRPVSSISMASWK